MTAHDVCFSVRGVKDLFPDLLLERGQEKSSLDFFKNVKNMRTLAQVYYLQAIAGGDREVNWYIWIHWGIMLGHKRVRKQVLYPLS